MSKEMYKILSTSTTSPTNAVKVKVNRIQSMTDPETGKSGKNIELVQIRQRTQQTYYGGVLTGSDEANVIKNIMSQFQSMGLVPTGNLPKVNLFLSEGEYDLLGVRFEVNEVYDMILRDGTIRFSKSLEGV